MIVLWGAVMIRDKFFYLPEETAPVSTVAVRRCLRKLDAFKENNFIRKMKFNELELNSAFDEEIKKGLYLPTVNLNVKISKTHLTFQALTYIFQFIPEKIRKYIRPSSPVPEEENIEKYLAMIAIDTIIKIPKPGIMVLEPHGVTIGKVHFPTFVGSILKWLKPKLFTHEISRTIRTVELRKGELILHK